MAEDLGTWPPEQATVLLEVLQKAGLSPQARRTREGVVVTVPDGEAEEAHRQLVANMDTIARAAKRAPHTGSRRRPRPVLGADNGRDDDRSKAGFGRLARPLLLLVLGLLLAAALPGGLRFPLVVFTVAGVIYLVGKQGPHDGEVPPPRRR